MTSFMRGAAALLTLLCLLLLGSRSHADVVQSKSTSATSGNGALTLTSAPTVGNLILGCLASGSTDPNAIVNTTGWTVLAHGGSGNGFLLMVYRYVVGGDTAALPNMLTASGGFQVIEAAEVTGVSGTIGTDVEGTPTAQYNTSTSTVAVGPVTTLHNNDLGMLCAANYDGNGNLSLSGGSFSWNVVQLASNFSNYGAWGYWKSFVLTSGSSVSGTLTPNVTSHPMSYIMAVLNGVGTPTSLQESSKINTYDVLQLGVAGRENASKANAYFVLQYSSSMSKENSYFVLKNGDSRKFPFHGFPP